MVPQQTHVHLIITDRFRLHSICVPEFYETSALTDINIQEAFYTIVRAIRARKDREHEDVEKVKKHKSKRCKLL